MAQILLSCFSPHIFLSSVRYLRTKPIPKLYTTKTKLVRPMPAEQGSQKSQTHTHTHSQTGIPVNTEKSVCLLLTPYYQPVSVFQAYTKLSSLPAKMKVPQGVMQLPSFSRKFTAPMYCCITRCLKQAPAGLLHTQRFRNKHRNVGESMVQCRASTLPDTAAPITRKQ